MAKSMRVVPLSLQPTMSADQSLLIEHGLGYWVLSRSRFVRRRELGCSKHSHSQNYGSKIGHQPRLINVIA